jgi:hypothetical protein
MSDMSKVLVECRIPAADTTIDISVPFEKPLYETLVLISEIFKDNRSFAPDKTAILCDGKTGKPHDLSRTPEELGFRIGESLLLM